MDERRIEPPEPQDEDAAGAGPPRDEIEEPAKLIRIAAMTRELLGEVRAAPLDDAGVDRLREIHKQSVVELKDILSADLGRELDELAFDLDEVSSAAELRVAQAQLAGWLEGLFQGIRAAMWTQQMQAIGAGNRARLPGVEPGEPGAREPQQPGLYL